jgi:hypothetical protein
MGLLTVASAWIFWQLPPGTEAVAEPEPKAESMIDAWRHRPAAGSSQAGYTAPSTRSPRAPVTLARLPGRQLRR